MAPWEPRADEPSTKQRNATRSHQEPCAAETRAQTRAYERLEDMNDCRFLHYWKLSIFPGRYMYRTGGCERTVHSLQFLPGKSFTASNRSYPAKKPRRMRSSSTRTGMRQGSARTRHAANLRLDSARTRHVAAAATSKPDNKKGAHGSFESRAPTCAFSCCSHPRQNQQARSSRTAATNPTTRADAMLQSRLKPMWPTEPQSRSAPGPALAGPAGPRPASL